VKLVGTLLYIVCKCKDILNWIPHFCDYSYRLKDNQTLSLLKIISRHHTREVCLKVNRKLDDNKQAHSLNCLKNCKCVVFPIEHLIKQKVDVIGNIKYTLNAFFSIIFDEKLIHSSKS